MQMKSEGKKSIQHYMRLLHRYIGFFVLGLTLIYSFSGIVLIYRDTDFLKKEKHIEQQLAPKIPESELGAALHMSHFEILKSEGDTIYFINGTYNKTSGIAKYTVKALPAWIEKFNAMHKASSQNTVHWFTTIYGILLLFLALSAFWMFKSRSKMFKQGIIVVFIGSCVALVLLFLKLQIKRLALHTQLKIIHLDERF